MGLNYTKKHANQAGFTVVELVVVMLIISILAGIAGKSFFGYLNKAKISTTEANLKAIKGELRRYNEQVHKYPDSLQDLVRKPGDIATNRQWGGPYFGEEDEESREVPKDGWGQDFVYRVMPGNHPPFSIYSWGPNGPDSPEEERIA